MHRRLVVEVLPLVVKEADYMILVALEGLAGCLRAQMDHTAPAELAKEAQRHVPVLNARAGRLVDTHTLVAEVQCTARLHHKQAGYTETSPTFTQTLCRTKVALAFHFAFELAQRFSHVRAKLAV